MLKPQTLLFIALLCIAFHHIKADHLKKDTVNFSVGLNEEQEPNNPLPGINVKLTTLWIASEQDPKNKKPTAPKKPFSSTKKTDQDGNIDFGALPIGSYLVEVDDPRYLKRSQTVNLSSRYGGVGISLELAQIADLSGVVVDPKGNPIKGASLQFLSMRANEAKVVSDTDGRFVCRCPAGIIDMHVIAAGFAPISLPITLIPNTNPPSRIELKPSRALDVHVDFGALTPTEVPPIVRLEGPDGYLAGLQLWNWSSARFTDVPPTPVQIVIEDPGSGILVREEIAASSSSASFQLAPNQLIVEIERRGTPPKRPCCYTPNISVKCPSMPERSIAVDDNTPSATFYWLPSERCEVRYQQEPPIFATPSKLEKTKLVVSFPAP